MLVTTNNSDKAKLEKASIKAKRLCKLYNCSLIDLMVYSIKENAEINKAQKK